jgi:hypothetical protein
MEKMVTLPLLAYSSGLLTGERLREELYRGEKGALYSGLALHPAKAQAIQLARARRVLTAHALHPAKAQAIPPPQAAAPAAATSLGAVAHDGP